MDVKEFDRIIFEVKTVREDYAKSMLWKEDYYSQWRNFTFLKNITSSHNELNWAKYKLFRTPALVRTSQFNNSVRDKDSHFKFRFYYPMDLAL